jgi:hypothetical protein
MGEGLGGQSMQAHAAEGEKRRARGGGVDRRPLIQAEGAVHITPLVVAGPPQRERHSLAPERGERL